MQGKTSSSEVSVMPRSKRPRREHTHDWQRIKQYTLWPEQKVYELLRPVVLFNESAAERARETGAAERILQRKADLFESRGMASLFPKEPVPPSDDARELPPDMRQLIVDLKAEHPTFRPHEIATVCYVRFGRRPSHHTVQRVLASGPQRDRRAWKTSHTHPMSQRVKSPFKKSRKCAAWRAILRLVPTG